MRKIYIIIIALLLASFCADAQVINIQNNDSSKGSKSSLGVQSVRFGAKAGLNLSNLDQGNNYDFNYRFGFYIGIVEEFKITREIGFQPELVYSNQGAIDSNDSSVSYRLDYFSLPIMTNLYIGKTFCYQFGPEFGYNIYSSGKYVKNGIIINDFSDIKNFNFGFNMGLGMELNENISVNFRYHWGITEVRKNMDDRNLLMQLGIVAKL